MPRPAGRAVRIPLRKASSTGWNSGKYRGTAECWTHDAADTQHRAEWSQDQPRSGRRCLKTTHAHAIRMPAGQHAGPRGRAALLGIEPVEPQACGGTGSCSSTGRAYNPCRNTYWRRPCKIRQPLPAVDAPWTILTRPQGCVNLSCQGGIRRRTGLAARNGGRLRKLRGSTPDRHPPFCPLILRS